MNCMLNMWNVQGKGVFVMRQTNVGHVFGNLCITACKLMSKSEIKSIRHKCVKHVSQRRKEEKYSL
jgi:hypothetical protein